MKHVTCLDIFDIVEEPNDLTGKMVFKLKFKNPDLQLEYGYAAESSTKDNAEWEGDRWIRQNPNHRAVQDMIFEKAFLDDEAVVENIMNDLKTNGSKLSPGFMRPEGIVIEVAGKKYKKVFEAEETKWTQGSAGPKPPKIEYDASHLLQPIRLEKLLSKDERYVRLYPESLRDIVADYTQDLIDEGQIVGSELEIRSIKKAAGGQLFGFVRQYIDKIQPPQ